MTALLSRTVTIPTLRAITDQRTALILQIDDVGWVAARIIRQWSLGDSQKSQRKTFRSHLNGLIVGDAPKQVTESRNAITRDIGWIAATIAGRALPEAQGKCIWRGGDDRDCAEAIVCQPDGSFLGRHGSPSWKSDSG